MSNTSPLLSLPAELRLHIYGYVFTAHSFHEPGLWPCGTWHKGANSMRCIDEGYPAGRARIVVSNTITRTLCTNSKNKPRENFAALLRTCKIIHAEAVDVLYQQTLFHISLGSMGLESIGSNGQLAITQASRMREARDPTVLRDLTVFRRAQNVHINVDIACQTKPLADSLPVLRAILASLNLHRKRTTAALRFGLVAAVACVRISADMWDAWVQELATIEMGCEPVIEVDRDAQKWWTLHGKERFDLLSQAVKSEYEFVSYGASLSPQDDGLRACVIL